MARNEAVHNIFQPFNLGYPTLAHINRIPPMWFFPLMQCLAYVHVSVSGGFCVSLVIITFPLTGILRNMNFPKNQNVCNVGNSCTY